MTADVTLYTKSFCPACKSTKDLLQKLNVEFVEINIEEDPKILDFLKSQNFSSAPVVFTNDDSWSGFKPDKIRALAVSDTTDDDWGI